MSVTKLRITRMRWFLHSITRAWPRYYRSSRLRTCASEESFEEWLSAHPLPGAAQIPAASASTVQQHLRYKATRFSWQETPQVSARCLKHPQLVWSIKRGVLVGWATATGGKGTAVPVLRLELPRIVAGLFPELQEVLAPSDSPLEKPADAQHTAALRALRSLARHAQWGRAPGEASPEPQQAGEGTRGPGFSSLGVKPPLTAVESLGQPHIPPHLGELAGSACSGACSTATADAVVAGLPQGPHQGLQLGSQLLVLLSSDSAALALLREGEVVAHKVLTGYTIRRSQGKAQLTHERQRGGGARSAGGSIRRREGRRLFQAAAAKLAEWAPQLAACNQLYGGGTVWAWNELYSSRSLAVPVERRDPRWQRVGVGVRRPRLEDLEKVAGALLHGTLKELQE